jgi:amidase
MSNGVLTRTVLDTALALDAGAGYGPGERDVAPEPPGPGSVLLTPTLTRLPSPVGMAAKPGVSDDAGRFSVLTRIWNVTGQPAISLPLAATAEGVPVGVQLVGPPGRDDLLLSLAGEIERATDWTPSTRSER